MFLNRLERLFAPEANLPKVINTYKQLVISGRCHDISEPRETGGYTTDQLTEMIWQEVSNHIQAPISKDTKKQFFEYLRSQDRAKTTEKSE